MERLLMNLSAKEYGDIIVIYLQGSLDAVSVPSVQEYLEQFIQKKHLKIALNFTDVSYISSAGIRLLLSNFKLVQSLGGKMCLCCVKESVTEVMRIAGLDQLILLCQSEQECLSKL
ncbi:sigma-F 5-region regulatory protein spoIIAA [Chlamydia pneumoniae TW-183]|uniref:Anti-sigma factor antagonist n=3 Tax=Chlamydia pneumoniae TaxID=83558 RepID=A0A0F7WXF0_CHLPN|nr:sigma-F 5-region regulatory protein spoIIAA [Chlamydia pneumoniae TW-183]CRI33440.1 Anti-sigma factor antagonist [Chlamydia pneumoniae]CRI36303.1 Anti-sigma factor antagonist [Chlamydia pneumoniae]CRI37430.1 Anti-sigma factor antagonist [Chlamydia pneumoniae]CRI38560.1 Anti-sigma factor antagonist [Chlamydia pneumoniae]